MPVLFVGHGSPMNVIEDNRWSQGFAALRELVPKPTAIVAVSAHWFVDGTYLTDNTRPKTIHDFSGFPPALYEIDYPAPGQVDLARRVRGMLGEERAALSSEWGWTTAPGASCAGCFPRQTSPSFSSASGVPSKGGRPGVSRSEPSGKDGIGRPLRRGSSHGRG
jgi:4,5-DOPA dioxygenase extradiol